MNQASATRKNWFLASRYVYLILAALTVLVAMLFVYWKPELIKDAPTSLSTVASFAGLLGLTVALIEIFRLKGATELARSEARSIFDRVTQLVTAREIADCQGTIDAVLSKMDEDGEVPTRQLHQITKLYSQVFSAKFDDPTSIHRQNRSAVQAYALKPGTVASSQALKFALLGIAMHLGEVQGLTKVFEESKS